MGSDGRRDRVVMSVVCKGEKIGVVKKNLEKSRIIYAEDDGKIKFSVMPILREKDLQRSKEILRKNLELALFPHP